MIDTTFMNAVLQFISKGPQGAPAATDVVAASNRTALAADLRSYGEDSVASALEAATDDTVLSIAQRGIQISFTGENIPRSLCLAAVETIEGRLRPLARKRRKRARRQGSGK